MPTITFRRASNIQNIPITDGQIIFDTARNIILMDNGNVRNQYAGATQLISTTPEATNTNAFNAQAATQLFLQKTTVIDTKANALAVNQNYVPLGCLAFKEALGTTNYSNVGNGTISGALVKFNDQLRANGLSMYMDYQNGKYGVNTSPNRGADTFIPFKSSSEDIILMLYSGTPVNEYQGLFSIGVGVDDWSGGIWARASDSRSSYVDIPLFKYNSDGDVTHALNTITMSVSTSTHKSLEQCQASASASYTITTDTGNNIDSGSASKTINLFGTEGLTGATSLRISYSGSVYAFLNGEGREDWNVSASASASESLTLKYIELAL